MRHPDTIIWSNDLLADAGRRDFTINAMYYSKLPATSYQLPAAGKDHNKLETGSWELVASLKNNGWAVQDGVLIIQNHELIASLLP
jgi:hypothetical protein